VVVGVPGLNFGQDSRLGEASNLPCLPAFLRNFHGSADRTRFLPGG
jgi:hypothetical protein